jgi:hypothetical protein
LDVITATAAAILKLQDSMGLAVRSKDAASHIVIERCNKYVLS